MKKLLFAIAINLCHQVGAGQATDTAKAHAFSRAAWDVLMKDYFKKSIRLSDSAIFYKSNDWWSYMIKGEAHAILGEYNQAVIAYKKWLTNDTTILQIGARVTLGAFYEKAGMHKEAIEQYASAIELWESGYRPNYNPQMNRDEELKYIIAVGLYGDSSKWKHKLKIFSEKHPFYPHHNLLDMLKLTREELLQIPLQPYSLPKGVVPRED